MSGLAAGRSRNTAGSGAASSSGASGLAAVALALGGTACAALATSRRAEQPAVYTAFTVGALPATADRIAVGSRAPLEARYPSQAVGVSSGNLAIAGFVVAAGGRWAARRRLRSAREAGAESKMLPKVDRDTTKAFRKDLMRSEQYFKFGRTQMEKAMKELKSVSGSDLVTQLRTNGFRLTLGDVTFVLAESYGFCWGVQRAVAMALEARNYFPDKQIWVTNEIIHNPQVNERIAKLGMKIIKPGKDGDKDFSVVSKGDVVVLPAFGASVDLMSFLKGKEAQIVDTTCPWVSKVWNSVEKTKERGHTAIIHGKYNHEETVATKSFAKKYVVVKNMAEAEYVAQYILGYGNREEFMKKFAKAVPEDFDPDVDLVRVGIANQTTMLKGETELIGKLFERVMIRKYGPQKVDEHFVSFNTICDATQERQDAMYKMFDAAYEAPKSKLYADLEGQQVGVDLKSSKSQEALSSKVMEDKTRGASGKTDAGKPKIDLVIVVGGFNSSNTTHLVEIPQELGCPAYHVDCAARIGGGGTANTIQHKPLETPPAKAMMDEGLKVTENFLPDGPVVIGLTAGASTPDSVLGDCMRKILEMKGVPTPA